MATERSRLIEGLHPGGGRVFAAVEASVRHASPGLAGLRIGALATPFPSSAAALEALQRAGAVVKDQHHGQ